jgi:hypothetical protein
VGQPSKLRNAPRASDSINDEAIRIPVVPRLEMYAVLARIRLRL